MSTYIISTGSSHDSGWQDQKTRPEFRKATKNMLMVSSAVKQTLGDLIIPPTIGLVLGSSYGELETTKDFLITFARLGIARPFLFSSSLHNATSGFVSLHFGIKGPSVTISQRFFTAENSLEAATILLSSGQCSLCLVVVCDSLVEDLADGFSEAYPSGTKLTEGATAILLANNEGLKLIEKNPLGLLGKIKFDETNLETEREGGLSYYDSNALDLLRADLLKLQPEFNLTLLKPNGSHSVIEWARLGV
jgi:hypothetical protein